MSVLTALIEHSAGSSIQAMRQEKEIKDIEIENEDIQLSLC